MANYLQHLAIILLLIIQSLFTMGKIINLKRVSGVKATHMACVQEKLYACDFSANGPMLSVKRDSAGQLIPKTHRLYPGGIGAVNNLFKVDTTLFVLNHRDHKGLYRFQEATETFQRIDPVSENIIHSSTHHGISKY